jgi:ribonuclease HI
MSTMIEAYFDGACEPNPNGVASYGAVIRRDGQTIWQASERVLDRGAGTSNNLAEYAALIAVLRRLFDVGLERERIVVIGDSQLVINQMFGNWKIKRGCYVELAYEAKALVTQFPRIEGKWVPRDRNTVADELSKAALGMAQSSGGKK